MTIGTVRLVGASTLILLVSMACGNGDDGDAGGVRSQQGESCERSADCAGGLACFSGTCRPADAKVTPNARECAAIQCEAPAECCTTAWTRSASCDSYRQLCDSGDTSYCALADGPTCVCTEANYACEENLCRAIECQAPADCCRGWVRPSTCDTYQAYCDSDPVANDYYCQYVIDNCTCNEASFDCLENMCVSVDTCTDGAECISGFCVGGRCVDCEVDGDCSNADATCIANRCEIPECETNLDCPSFFACEAGVCNEVGCATDRECMVYESSYLATCDKAATPFPECVVRCASDAECYESSNPLRVCVGGQCVDPGCDTDEECKLRLSSSIVAMQGVRAVCRDKVAP